MYCSKDGIGLNDFQKALLNKLMFLREKIAKKMAINENVICNDGVLIEIAKTMPLDSKELKALNGIEEKFVVKYGDYFIKVIKEYKICFGLN